MPEDFGIGMLRVRTLAGLKPGSVPCSAHRLRIISPAPIEKNNGQRHLDDNERPARIAAARVAVRFAEALFQRIVEIASYQSCSGD